MEGSLRYLSGKVFVSEINCISQFLLGDMGILRKSGIRKSEITFSLPNCTQGALYKVMLLGLRFHSHYPKFIFSHSVLLGVQDRVGGPCVAQKVNPFLRYGQGQLRLLQGASGLFRSSSSFMCMTSKYGPRDGSPLSFLPRCSGGSAFQGPCSRQCAD